MIGAVSLSTYDLSTLSLFNFFGVFALWSFPSFGKNFSSPLCKRVLDREKPHFLLQVTSFLAHGSKIKVTLLQ